MQKQETRMRYIVLLRGVMPVGKNKIPKMSYLVSILEIAGFKNVQTFIQSGNILLDTDEDKQKTAEIIHDVILDKIGADLSVIIKTKQAFTLAIQENPFDETYDYLRIHLVFSNEMFDEEKLKMISETDFGDEKFAVGSECLYMYLPRDAKKKRLNNNFLEKKLGVICTMRKLNVIEKLCARY